MAHHVVQMLIAKTTTAVLSVNVTLVGILVPQESVISIIGSSKFQSLAKKMTGQ